jgi:hypothetical protein
MSKLPITLSEWPRNARDTIRVSLTEYRGVATLDIREFYPDAGARKPGKKGITLPVASLPKLAIALHAAMKIAEAEGLIKKGEAGR